MLLLILESLGTWELMLIGVVALVIFGPRKIPELARKAGKMMAEFRKVSSDFRNTWEQEALLGEDEKNAFKFDDETIAREMTIPEEEHPSLAEANIAPEFNDEESDLAEMDVQDESETRVPEIRELTDKEQIEKLKSSRVDESIDTDESHDKENWF